MSTRSRKMPYFTLLAIENAYWNIPIREEDKDKTGFVTPFGRFRYERMAFGLSGAPSTFQRIMDTMLVGLRDAEVLVYLDDLLIFSATIEDHVRRMRLVFDRVREANFKLNVAKCTFAVPEVVYLGHVVNKKVLLRTQVKFWLSKISHNYGLSSMSDHF
jgi:hypothetical protein